MCVSPIVFKEITPCHVKECIDTVMGEQLHKLKTSSCFNDKAASKNSEQKRTRTDCLICHLEENRDLSVSNNSSFFMKNQSRV